jgi:putative NIF3 family GTP cyclohydrolase 1 type 2
MHFLGGSVFSGVRADLFITGEMGHHQVLEICDRLNSTVLLTEHSNCERGYLKDVLSGLLKKTLSEFSGDDFEVEYSQVDLQDPLSII